MKLLLLLIMAALSISTSANEIAEWEARSAERKALEKWFQKKAEAAAS